MHKTGPFPSASEMTDIVSGGALNSTHSLVCFFKRALAKYAFWPHISSGITRNLGDPCTYIQVQPSLPTPFHSLLL